MNFSIIIINYNTAQLILDCINSIFLLQDFFNFEIIVVDNGSSKSDVNILNNRLDKNIKFIKSGINLGFSGGNNLGAKYATGKYLFFLNSDTIIKKNIFNDILKIFLRDKMVGIISPRLINLDGSLQAKSYGPFPSIKYLLYKNIISKNDNDFPKHIDWVSGAALFIRRDIFDKIGGWDDGFFLYLEDVDLCWMVKKLGYKIILDDSTEIIHLQGGSLSKNRLKQKYYYNSQRYLFKKHYGMSSVFILLLIRLPHKLLFLLKSK